MVQRVVKRLCTTAFSTFDVPVQGDAKALICLGKRRTCGTRYFVVRAIWRSLFYKSGMAARRLQWLVYCGKDSAEGSGKSGVKRVAQKGGGGGCAPQRKTSLYAVNARYHTEK